VIKLDIHIFIIWEKARNKTDILLEDIRKHFTIKEIYEVSWTKENFTKNLRRFYGTTLPNPDKKAEICGKGKFLVIIIEDKKQNIDWRKTSIGKQLVNTNVYDIKKVYRRLIGGQFPIHGSINNKETDHDLTLIFRKNLNEFQQTLPNEWNGEIKSFDQDLVGAEKWNDLNELFYVLNTTTNYIVLRNFEGIPNQINLDMHNDIDILTDDKWQITHILNKQILKNSKGIPRPCIIVGDKKISIDLRYVGDIYYDEKWAKKMLENKVRTKNGVNCPNIEDYFYSLLYHALIHKSKISPDYITKLVELAKKNHIKDFSEDIFSQQKKLKKILDIFLQNHGYRYTDSLSYKIRHNELSRLADVAVKTSKHEGTGYLFRAIRGKIKKKFSGIKNE
jgi:hypothetical protein